MDAVLILRTRISLSDVAFADIAIWQVPEPVRGSLHSYKYRLAYVVNETCVVRFDNEAGKGDHKHVGDQEVSYAFTTLRALQDDFWSEVAKW